MTVTGGHWSIRHPPCCGQDCIIPLLRGRRQSSGLCFFGGRGGAGAPCVAVGHSFRRSVALPHRWGPFTERLLDTPVCQKVIGGVWDQPSRRLVKDAWCSPARSEKRRSACALVRRSHETSTSIQSGHDGAGGGVLYPGPSVRGNKKIPPTAIGDPRTAVDYPPTAIGCPPTAVGYPPTAVGDPPTTSCRS